MFSLAAGRCLLGRADVGDIKPMEHTTLDPFLKKIFILRLVFEVPTQ